MRLNVSCSVTSLLALYCLFLSAATTARAQTTGTGEVEVANVKFSNVRDPENTTATWYEIEVELTAKPDPAGGNRFVNRVRVALNLGIEVSSASAKKVDFYRAEAEAVALEAGKSSVRFYLPPEVVKRDSVRGNAKFHLVELSIGGQPVPLARGQFSASTLQSPEVVNSFKSKIASEAAANDGVLVPQYVTPFEYERNRPAPTYLRGKDTFR